MNNGPIVIEGRERITLARLLTLRRAIELEALGLRLSRGRSATAIVRTELGLPRSCRRIAVQAELEEAIARAWRAL